MGRSLTKLAAVQKAIMHTRLSFYRRFWGMTIDPTAHISLKANLDKTYPQGVHIGANTWLAFNVVVLTHDRVRGLYLDTEIGENCFIGGNSIILPGVKIGNGCVVGAGSVVVRDVESGSIVAGNPAKVIKTGMELLAYGRYPNADETTHQLKREGLVKD
ncbi:acyltransferase [Actinomycetes bacterium M1A6_2h]